MLDFDGTLRFYDRDIPPEIYALLLERVLQPGVHLALNSCRAEPRRIEQFFLDLERIGRSQNKEIDFNHCHIYLRNGTYGYNLGTGTRYYEVELTADAWIAIRQTLRREEFSRFIYPNSYKEESSRALFVF